MKVSGSVSGIRGQHHLEVAFDPPFPAAPSITAWMEATDQGGRGLWPTFSFVVERWHRGEHGEVTGADLLAVIEPASVEVDLYWQASGPELAAAEVSVTDETSVLLARARDFATQRYQTMDGALTAIRRRRGRLHVAVAASGGFILFTVVRLIQIGAS